MSMGNGSQAPASSGRIRRPGTCLGRPRRGVPRARGVLTGAAGCGGEHKTLSPDEELIAFFHAHRVDLDSLRETDQEEMRQGANGRDPELVQRWGRLIRRLGLPGGERWSM